MDRFSAVNQLPTVHAVAIRLKDSGFDDRVIAVAAGIDEHEVAMLLRIAKRKLSNLMSLEADRTSPAGSSHLPDRGP